MDNKGQLLTKLQSASGLADRAQVELVAESVLRQLHSRLGPEADHLEAQLPGDLKPLFTGGALGKAAEALTPHGKFDFEQMIDQVARDGGVDRSKAQQITITLFHELKEHVSDGEVNHVAAVLPADIKQIWQRA